MFKKRHHKESVRLTLDARYVDLDDGRGSRWLLPVFIRSLPDGKEWFRIRTIEEAACRAKDMEEIGVACEDMYEVVKRKEGEPPEQLGKRLIREGVYLMASASMPRPRLSPDRAGKDEERWINWYRS